MASSANCLSAASRQVPAGPWDLRALQCVIAEEAVVRTKSETAPGSAPLPTSFAALCAPGMLTRAYHVGRLSAASCWLFKVHSPER